MNIVFILSCFNFNDANGAPNFHARPTFNNNDRQKKRRTEDRSTFFRFSDFFLCTVVFFGLYRSLWKIY